MQLRHREKNSPSRYSGPGFTSEPGDVVDVDPDVGERLLEEKRYFVRAETAASGDAGDADIDAGASTADGEFDVEEWLEADYDDRAARVEAGEVDEHLEAIAEAETSDTVLDAIGVRRAELEE
jgi:hypothetical protein